MSIDPNPSPEQQRAALSAVMDGDADASDAACVAWRNDAAARSDWHVYHLISDLMRSDEHRADAAHDARMLARLREQLKKEPVVLAPLPAPSTKFAQNRRARAWLMPTAIAAGFAAVAGALVVARVADVAPADRAGVVAATPTPVPVVRAALAEKPPVPLVVEDAPTMLRSAELDRYLAAHRQYANGALQVAPGGVVRQAAVAAPGR
jgi:sigma-E factor negative regulatory protein RseA